MLKKETPFGDLEVFDAHAHFFSYNFYNLLSQQSPELSQSTDPLAKIAEITGFELPVSSTDLAKRWVDELDKHRISQILLMSSIPGDETSISEAVLAAPERIVGGFFFNPKAEDALTLAERSFDDLKLKMVSLFPAMHGYMIDEDPTVRGVAELGEARTGTIIFVHCGKLSVGIRKKLNLPHSFDSIISSPLRVANLAAKYPGVNFIIPHFGAGLWREALKAAIDCPNIYIDTSSGNGWMNDEPDMNQTRIFEEMLKTIGANRLLFGTDSSFFPRGWVAEVFEEQAGVLAKIGVDVKDAEAIFGNNLKGLLSGSD